MALVTSNTDLFHFTTLNTAIEYILYTGKLRFSPYSVLNDPRENKNWNVAFYARPSFDREKIDDLTNGNIDYKDIFNMRLKNSIKTLCFTGHNSKNIYHGEGFCRTRMWAQYGENHRGVCLVFDEEKLSRCIKNSFSNKKLLMKGKVNYVDVDDPYIFALSYEDLYANTIEAVIEKHLLKYGRNLYFNKASDWQDECEHRWVFMDEDDKYKYFDFDDALKGIIIGIDFPKAYESLIKEYAKKYNVVAEKMEYKNGMPYLIEF